MTTQAAAMRKGETAAAQPRTCILSAVTYACAFCGEENDVFADPSGGRRQTFTEDCTVCCRPNLIALTFDDDGDVEIEVSQEYEA